MHRQQRQQLPPPHRVVVAFDAMGNAASLGSTQSDLLSTGVTVAFCGDCEAEHYVMQQVDYWLDRNHEQVVIATNDRASVVDSKMRAEEGKLVVVVSSNHLIYDMAATRRRWGSAGGCWLDGVSCICVRPTSGGGPHGCVWVCGRPALGSTGLLCSAWVGGGVAWGEALLRDSERAVPPPPPSPPLLAGAATAAAEPKNH